jgi:peptide-methionine (S)-S-oxide reductase
MKSVFSLLTFTLFSMSALAASSDDKGAVRGEEYAIFAGGCFWCVEADFDKVPGVLATLSGYVGGHLSNPTYEQVSAGGTGHAEAVRVTFDPQTVSYAELLDVFWHSIDPTTVDSQFCDHGDQYRTAIFYTTPEQEAVAHQSLASLMQSKPFANPIVTEITAAGMFYPAEEYHQDYYMKHPLRYRFYRLTCGRDGRLEDLWGARE